jgi:hypothetical protein
MDPGAYKQLTDFMTRVTTTLPTIPTESIAIRFVTATSPAHFGHIVYSERRRGDRFIHEPDSHEYMFIETGVDCNLSETHAVLDWRYGARCPLTPFSVDSVPSLVQKVLMHYELDYEPPLPAAARVRWLELAAARSGIPEFAAIKPYLMVVHLFTLENPAIYKDVNSMLANKNMWKERYPVYYGFNAGCGVEEGLFNLLKDYTNALIVSLFLLSEIKMISTEACATPLYYGGHFEQDRRARSTVFRSTTRSVLVLQAFGAQSHQRIYLGPHRVPALFDIADLSAFPDEQEVLLLPGLCGDSWFGNSEIHGCRFLEAQRLLKKLGTMPPRPAERRVTGSASGACGLM